MPVIAGRYQEVTGESKTNARTFMGELLPLDLHQQPERRTSPNQPDRFQRLFAVRSSSKGSAPSFSKARAKLLLRPSAKLPTPERSDRTGSQPTPRLQPPRSASSA